MKRLLFFVFIFLLTLNSTNAISDSNVPVNFIYLNGSNTNTDKSKDEFINGITNAHSYIKNSLEGSVFVRENLLKSGNYVISDNPEIYFWGFESKDDLKAMDESLSLISMFSPRLAQTTRSFISHCMHDAIWVQKSYNMQKVIDELNSYVKKSYEEGEKIILSGYSAGSFISYEYLIHKLPAVDMQKLLDDVEENSEDKVDDYFKSIKLKPTCLDAIISSKLAVYTANGEFIPNDNFEVTKSAYKNLDFYTDKYCAPADTVLGVINFASPLALFYSDMSNQSLDINKYNIYLFKYMKENNIFMLTVNFADDPMGFPLSTNVTASDIELISGIKFSKSGRGFVYTKSDVKSPNTFLSAHLSYWKHPKKFAKMITDGYVEGFKNFYGLK